MEKLIVRFSDGDVAKVDEADRHEAKSVAGKIFRKDCVKSVCVANRETGSVALYLNKDRPRNVWVNQ
jgi:L-fucose isomerase-like protein